MNQPGKTADHISSHTREVSIIVPVYNCEAYLEDSLQSVLSQTYPHWELILVDDGSTDRSAAICERYAANDERIKLIRQKNAGVSAARNRGMKHAAGAYITFLDADDIYAPEHLHLMVETMEKTGVDLVDTGFLLFNDNRIPKTFVDAQSKRCHIINGQENILSNYLYQKGLECGVWCKLFRAELIRDLYFKEGLRYEDMLFSYFALKRCRKVALTGANTYLYRQYSESYMHRFNSGRMDVITVTDMMLRDAEKTLSSLIPAAQSRCFSAYCNILALIVTNNADMPRERDICRQGILRLRKQILTDRHVRLQNKAAALASYIAGFALLNLLFKLKYK